MYSVSADEAHPVSASTSISAGRGMTMSDQLARHARIDGARTAFVYGDVRRSYHETDARVSALANAFRARGVEAGDRVTVLGFNTLEVIESYFAAARIGAICVPINFRLVAHEIAYIIQDCTPTVSIVQNELHALMSEAQQLAGSHAPLLVYGETNDQLPVSEPQGTRTESYEALLASSPRTWAGHTVQLPDPAFIVYTSGTTGLPKGAVLTHEHLFLHTFNSIAHADAPPLNERVNLAAAPLFHVAALAGLLKPLFLGGRTIVQPFGKFEPDALLDLVERERISSLFLVPTQWQAVCALENIEQRDLSSLTRIAWGAAPATTSLLEQMNDKFPGAQIVSVFGQTECGPITVMLQGADQVRKIGSIGRPTLNVEVRVVDDEMRDVEPGEVGEIVYRTPMVMKEYWNKPEATAEAFRGGWFHSGDLVRQDSEGYLFIVDRKKDMIISGGENIYCAEVENIITGHPQVREVSLIGLPHEKWGETPLAVIVPEHIDAPPTPAELTSWLSDRLARYKRPQFFAIVTDLPRNSTGKVVKAQIRQHCADGKYLLHQA